MRGAAPAEGAGLARALRLLGGVEAATLALMLANIATAHHPAISGALGPLHGLAYAGVFILALNLPGATARVRLLALVPGIGGLLAHRSHARA